MAKGSGVNLRELMTGILTRTRYVHRWSTFHTLHKESVAEHSFFVAFYVLVIGSWLNQDRIRINLDMVLQRALVHDLDEAYSGDFIRSFKHSSPELKQALDDAAQSFHRKICEAVVDGIVAADMHHSWQVAKDETMEGRLLAFCDFLSVASYAVLERMAGNTHISQESTHLLEYAQTFFTEDFDFLSPLTVQAYELIQEVMK
jgi:5'-deoxynucleotidase YfbR-like HD superfamily hydrolase